MPASPTPERTGLLLGVTAYGLWGFLPLYFPLLAPAGPVEIIAHRVLWSLVFCVAILLVTGTWRTAVAAARRGTMLATLALAGVLVATNWLVFVAGVLGGHTVDAALGYYINPLVTVTPAVVFLGERLRRLQVFAIIVALIAVAVATREMGGVPWISLGLAGSFSLYSLIKKGVGGKVDALTGLMIETAAIAPVAIVVLLLVQRAGDTTFGVRGAPGLGWGHDVMLAGTGTWTAGALLLFAAGARRLPLNITGMLQYIAPTMTFVRAVWYFHESMPAGRWVGFGFLWVALVLFSIDAWRIRPGGARAQLAREQRARDAVVVAAEPI